MPVAHHWGTTAAERTLAYACDRYVAAPRDELFRGVTVNVPAAVVFRWLCQLRAAPYSYDWIDNLGRRSPQRLIPGLESLVIGQRVMRSSNWWSSSRTARSPCASSNEVERASCSARSPSRTWRSSDRAEGTRLLAKLALPRADGLLARLKLAALAWGDLVMMRRQLFNLRQLAESTACR